jgi:5-methyltetrahydrofolate--homocysteine methyltransferase
MKDASQNALVAAKLLHADTHDAFVAELKAEQENLRTQAGQTAPAGQTVTMQEAERKKLDLFG